jgi:uncharacterized protein YutE (UPF0331/DUF86 family)
VVDKTLLSAKLAELADRVDRIRTHSRPTVGELAADRDALDIVAFNLMLAITVCADIANHLIADEGWPAPQSLAESFERLEQQGVLDAATREHLCRAVGLRNVVAHGYGRVNVAMVHAGATQGLTDLENFAREVAEWASHH